jgi:hypothetical protein
MAANPLAPPGVPLKRPVSGQGLLGWYFMASAIPLCVTNMRRAGVDYFRIMAITGHRTIDVFKRYHTIDQGDLRQAVSQLDTYMETSPTSPAESARNSLTS